MQGWAVVHSSKSLDVLTCAGPNRLIEQGLTSPPTQYRLSARQFYRSKDCTNSIKVLKEKNATKVRKTQKK